MEEDISRDFSTLGIAAVLPNLAISRGLRSDAEKAVPSRLDNS